MPAAWQHTNVTLSDKCVQRQLQLWVCVCECARECVLHCHVVRTARWTAGVSVHLVPCCTISSSNIKYPGGSQTRRRSDFFSCHDSPQKMPETAPAKNSWVMDWNAVGTESVFDPPWGSAARSKWGLENEGCLCWAVRVWSKSVPPRWGRRRPVAMRKTH